MDSPACKGTYLNTALLFSLMLNAASAVAHTEHVYVAMLLN
jgi:hypothetical protein